MSLLKEWEQKVKTLKINLYIIYLASRDPRIPWYAKFLALCVVAYAFSPIDLIPDFIPILGYLDDFILLPLGIIAVLKLIPREILELYRFKAEDLMNKNKPKNWIAAFLIILIWVSIGMVLVIHFLNL